MNTNDQSISATLPQSIFSFLEQASSNDSVKLDSPHEMNNSLNANMWNSSETPGQASFMSPNPLQNVLGLPSLDTGLTPTPTNDNVNLLKSPDADILTPRTKLDASILRNMSSSGSKDNSGLSDTSGVLSMGTSDLSDSSMEQGGSGDVTKETNGQAITVHNSQNMQSSQPQMQLQKEQEQLLAAAQLLNVNQALLNPLYYPTVLPGLIGSQQGNQELLRVWLDEVYGRNNPSMNELLLRTLLASHSATYPYTPLPTLATYPLTAAAGLYGNVGTLQQPGMSNNLVSTTVSESSTINGPQTSGSSVGTSTNATGTSTNPMLTYQQEVSNIANYYRGVMHLSQFEDDIEKAANVYRNAAATERDPSYHWHGKLPMRSYKSASFSRKVFLGGVPWDITDLELQQAFVMYGSLSVLWPAKDNQMNMSRSQPKGYCYLLFENENSVRNLVKNCSRDVIANSSELYYKLSSTKMKAKEVQVIPWCVSDSQYTKQGSHRLDAKRTVFIGALHGMITAEALANIMHDLFGNVAFAALDTDKFKYPIGSGRVAFTSQKSYQKAVEANFVDVQTPKFNKTIQIDPYLEDSMCNYCFFSAGIYFCRAFDCFRYFCPTCWQIWHNSVEAYYNHKPLRRTFKKSA